MNIDRAHIGNNISLKESLDHVLNTYSTAKTEPFAGHPLGVKVRRTIPELLRKLPFIPEQIRVQGSVGQGNWANIPWIALMDKRITESTQRGVYIVYLFAEDMSAVYLTLNQGVTDPLRKGRREGYLYLQQKVETLRHLLPLDGFFKDDNIQLTSTGIGRDYQVSTIAYIRYDRGDIPEDNQLLADLENLMGNYQSFVDHQLQKSKHLEKEKDSTLTEVEDTLSVQGRLEHIKSYIRHKGFMYPDGWIENLYLSLKTRPFVILAGVSGTGKTKLVKLFAEALGATTKNGQFTLIPVRPDWGDPSDLIGYRDLSGAFRPGPLAEVLYEASKKENKNKIYFICLDEMNLARVEHYFSDVLSILETQEWQNGTIVTAPLIRHSALALDEDREKYGELTIPDNVYLIGTVNMDETTHPFSKKVLDRANTIEFNFFDLSQFPNDKSKNFLSPIATQNTFLRSEYLQLADAYNKSKDLIEKTTHLLVEINEVLQEIHAHVGFRIRDVVCFYMIYNQRYQLLTEDEAFDFQLLQKILPRIQGSSSSVKRVLLKLMNICSSTDLSINEYMEDASELYVGIRALLSKAKYPQSARKIAFMLRRLDEDGFTSYWLS